MRASAVLGFAILVLAPSVVAAKTIAVPRDHASIQAAVDAAGTGDRIVVSAGIYPENVVIAGKSKLILRGKKGARIDASENGETLRIEETKFRQELKARDVQAARIEKLDAVFRGLAESDRKFLEEHRQAETVRRYRERIYPPVQQLLPGFEPVGQAAGRKRPG